MEFLSVKGLRPLKSHKGFHPLTPPLFEKSGQKLLIFTAINGGYHLFKRKVFQLHI